MISADKNLIEYQEKRISNFRKIGIQEEILNQEEELLQVLNYSLDVVKCEDEIYTVQMSKENFMKYEKIMTKPILNDQKRPKNDRKDTELNKKDTENDKKGTKTSDLDTTNKDTQR